MSTTPAPLRISVLGSGSVGLALAASAARAGQQVTLLARGAAVALLREQGITVTGVCGEHSIPPQALQVADAAAAPPQALDCELLVVATKAYQVGPALQALQAQPAQAKPAGTSPRAVLLLQNGWGSADEARAALPAGVPVYSSIMMIGIERRSPVHVNVNVQASPIRVGTLSGAPAGPMREAVARLEAGFLPIRFEDPVEPAILDKFLFNSCLNAIGAVTRMSYGELLDNPHTRHLITRLADETLAVLRATHPGLRSDDGPGYVVRTLMPLVLLRAAAHRSSMLQDVEAGRRTEIDYLNGAVVRLGAQHGIATPCNDAIASLVKASETGG